MRRPSRCHGPETNRTVPNRVEFEPKPEPNSTWPGNKWQMLLQTMIMKIIAVWARDRSVAPKTGDTSCVNKPLTRWRLRCADSGAVAATAYQLDALNGNFFFFDIHETVSDCVCVCVDQRSFSRIVRKQLLLFIQEWALQHFCLALPGLSHLMCVSPTVWAALLRILSTFSANPRSGQAQTLVKCFRWKVKTNPFRPNKRLKNCLTYLTEMQ